RTLKLCLIHFCQCDRILMNLLHLCSNLLQCIRNCVSDALLSLAMSWRIHHSEQMNTNMSEIRWECRCLTHFQQAKSSCSRVCQERGIERKISRSGNGCCSVEIIQYPYDLAM